MYSLPHTLELQNQNANPISAHELECMGKEASRLYHECGKSLNDAVVCVVKQAHLSPEQVRRVIEFANVDAYRAEFRKEGAYHKYPDFDGGPADPAEVLNDLNDGGGGSVMDDGMSDYRDLPNTTMTDKVATDFSYSFTVQNPEAEKRGMLHKIAALKEKAEHLHESMKSKLAYEEATLNTHAKAFNDVVKQACLQGSSLGEVATYIDSICRPNPEFIKVAFPHLMGYLVDKGVFKEVNDMQQSMNKVASMMDLPDPSHELGISFKHYQKSFEKCAEYKKQIEEGTEGIKALGLIYKQASATDMAKGIAIASGVTAGVGMIPLAVQGVKRMITHKKDYNNMLSKSPVLKEYQKENPEQIKDYFSSLRKANPELTEDPYTASHYISKMVQYPEAAGATISEAMQMYQGNKTRSAFSANTSFSTETDNKDRFNFSVG